MTKIRILALDDDELILDLLERGLACEGFEVERATSAEAARAILERSTPDFVLMDVNIPGMTRDDVLALMRERQRSRFVLFSAEDGSRLRMLTSEIGAHGWLSKSTPLDGIARELRRMYGSTNTNASVSDRQKGSE